MKLCIQPYVALDIKTGIFYQSELLEPILSRRYCTSKHNLNVSQILPFIENEESFRKFCHGGTTWNSILRGTTVTDF